MPHLPRAPSPPLVLMSSFRQFANRCFGTGLHVMTLRGSELGSALQESLGPFHHGQGHRGQ